ncbi:hypothetical protein DVH24_040982 [Malus domestica]|uniref:Uncharacterized protein n=1 Tax=Malus domestica TaxID=3750 RepID=A0A498ICS8_MALDO|nr:hypothetical protein DVH24_040982 [Malus domestica]
MEAPEVEVCLYRQGKGPIDVFKSGLGGWDQNQLGVEIFSTSMELNCFTLSIPNQVAGFRFGLILEMAGLCCHLEIEPRQRRAKTTRMREEGSDRECGSGNFFRYIESGSKCLVDMFNRKTQLDVVIEGIIFDVQCLKQQLRSVEFIFTPRVCNKATHLVASFVAREEGFHNWDGIEP